MLAKSLVCVLAAVLSQTSEPARDGGTGTGDGGKPPAPPVRRPQRNLPPHFHPSLPSVPPGAAEPEEALVVVSQSPRIDRYADESLAGLPITIGAEATLGELVEVIGRAANATAFADWPMLGGAKIAELTVGVPLDGVRLEDALRVVNSRAWFSFDLVGGLAVRRTGRIVEVSALRVFDRREMSTRAYDIRSLLPAVGPERDARVRSISSAVMTSVDMTVWNDASEDGARLSELDGRLFVVAPARVHAGVAWVLEQLSGREVKREVVRPGP